MDLQKKADYSKKIGIISFLTWLIPLIGIPVSIIGLVFGITSYKILKNKNSKIGIVLCTITLLIAITNALSGAISAHLGNHNFVNSLFNVSQFNENVSFNKKIFFKYKFTIMVPENWDSKESNISPLLISLSPKESLYDKYQENVIVGVDLQNNKNVTLDDYYKISVNSLRESLSHFIHGDEGTIKINESIFKWKEYIHEVNGLSIKSKFFCTKRGRYCFYISFNSLNKDFDKYNVFFNKIIKSFKFE